MQFISIPARAETSKIAEIQKTQPKLQFLLHFCRKSTKLCLSRICAKKYADFQSRNFSKIATFKLEKKRRSLVKILMNKKFDVQSLGISNSL